MTSFWKTKALAELSAEEWESLCDGCAKCCLIKLVDDDGADDTGREGKGAASSDETFYTNVACRLLDLKTCRCGDYAKRASLVPDCVVLSPETLPRVVSWLPGTCAYRLLWEGRDLPSWHPLLSGEADSPHREGISLRGGMVGEQDVPEDDLEDHILPKSRIDAGADDGLGPCLPLSHPAVEPPRAKPWKA